MAKLTPLSSAKARKVLSGYDFEVSQVDVLDGGSVNSNFCVKTRGGERLFLRIYEEQDADGAARELALLNELAACGVPTPAARPAKDGAVLAKHRGKPVAVFPFLDAHIVCQARVTPERCRAVGDALARVHLCPVEFVHPGRFTLADLRRRLDAALEYPAFRADIERIRAALERFAALRDPSLPTGLIHGDLFRDNVLWDDGHILALIDFESASHGVLAYDLMVTVLAWCFGDGFDTELAAAMLESYHARRPLSPAEIAALPVEGALAALRFATTRITDYSLRAPPGVPPLRDYRRFLQRLDAIEAGALGPAVARLKTR